MRQNQKTLNPIEQIKRWLQDVVIEHNFCPFAKREFDQGHIRFKLCEEADHEKVLATVLDECQLLDTYPEIETILIVFSNALGNYDQYLNIVELADELMNIQGYDGVYQLATFHPDYCFAGVDKADASNYTNRAPFPVLHIIREASLEKALESYPDAKTIPEKNIELSRQLGATYFRHILKNITGTNRD